MKEIKSPKATIAGNNIKAILNEISMIQQELADLTGLSSAHLSRIINNQRLCISLPIAFKIAEVLNRSVEEVFNAKSSKKENNV